MTRITQKELRDNLGEMLRRAEAGEELTVMVAGRPVARLRPARPRQWVGGVALQGVWQTPAPQTLGDDLARLPGWIGRTAGIAATAEPPGSLPPP